MSTSVANVISKIDSKTRDEISIEVCKRMAELSKRCGEKTRWGHSYYSMYYIYLLIVPVGYKLVRFFIPVG